MLHFLNAMQAWVPLFGLAGLIVLHAAVTILAGARFRARGE